MRSFKPHLIVSLFLTSLLLVSCSDPFSYNEPEETKTQIVFTLPGFTTDSDSEKNAEPRSATKSDEENEDEEQSFEINVGLGS